MRRFAFVLGAASLACTAGLAMADPPHQPPVDLSLGVPVAPADSQAARPTIGPEAPGQWSDDFNRPNAPTIGGDWTETTGTWGILNNQGIKTSGGIEYITHNLASLGYQDTVVELDVFQNSSSNAFVGVLIGLGGSNNILVKIQNQSGSQQFSHIGIYQNFNGGAWPGGAPFQALSSPFPSARITVFFPDANTLQVDIDTDFNGIPDQTYVSGNVSSISGGFGMGHGIMGWITDASFDNWVLGDRPGGTGDLFAVDSNMDQLFLLDKGNGSSTLIGSTLPAVTPAGLAWDTSTSTMYTIDLGGAGDLYKVNLSTGAVTNVGSSGINGWQGLASDPTDGGQLYGSNQNGNLYKVTKTGTATLIGPVGPLVASLEFDSTGQLWGIEFSSGQIKKIDKNNATSTVTGIASPFNFQGLAFDENDVAYGINTTTDSLYTINMNTGATTLVGSTGTDFVKGLGFELGAVTCYPDCDENGQLNIDDFICFQLQFALQNPYADCDGNQVFNIDDFICFQLAFALGC